MRVIGLRFYSSGAGIMPTVRTMSRCPDYSGKAADWLQEGSSAVRKRCPAAAPPVSPITEVADRRDMGIIDMNIQLSIDAKSSRWR